MSITFDELTTPPNSYIYFYDNSTDTLTARTPTSVTFDYFDDTAGVGDCIVFGKLGTHNSSNYRTLKFGSLQFNVGTALVATSITVVWEYWDADGTWKSLSNVTDNTNAFQNTGTNTVIFDVPHTWVGKGTLGTNTLNTSYLFIRCRITAVSGLSEGGQQQTDRLLFGDNMYHFNAETTTDPIGDILASDPGRPGITNINDVYYKCPHGFWAENSSTLSFLGPMMLDCTGSIGCETNSTINFGSITNGATSNGVMLYGSIGDNITDPNVNNSGGDVNFYESLIYFRFSGNNLTFIDTTVVTVRMELSSTWTIKNTIFDVYSFIRPYSQPTVDGLTIANQDVWYTGAVYMNSANLHIGFKNAVFINNTTDVFMSVATGQILTLTNPVGLSSSRFQLRGADNTVLVQYEMDLTVEDEDGTKINGASVKFTDGQGGTTTVTTDANGDITTQELLATKYYGITYPASSATMVTTDYSSYTIEISKSGYRTEVVPLTLTEKTKLTLSLSKNKILNLSNNIKIS